MIKRFDFTINGIVEAEGGNYVLHDDHARLIAAAPELLAALRLALEYWQDRQQRYKNRAPVWIKEARAAIAKATNNDKECSND